MLSWNPETLAVTLPIMLKGMVGIFAVIIVIWGFVALLNRIAGKKGKRPMSGTPPPAAHMPVFPGFRAVLRNSTQRRLPKSAFARMLGAR